MAVPTRILVVFLGVIALAVAIVPQGKPKPRVLATLVAVVPQSELDPQLQSPVTISVVHTWIAPDNSVMVRVRFRNRTPRPILIPFPVWSTCGNAYIGRPAVLIFSTQSEEYPRKIILGAFFKAPFPEHKQRGTENAIVLHSDSIVEVDAELGLSRELRQRVRVLHCYYHNPTRGDIRSPNPTPEPYIGSDGVLYGQIEAPYSGP